MKAFGEFFNNQIEYATTVVLSRSQNATPEQLELCVKQIQSINDKAAIITTPWDSIRGEQILKVVEGQDSLERKLMAEQHAKEEAEEHEHEHHQEHNHEDSQHSHAHDHHHDHEDTHHDHSHESHHHAHEMAESAAEQTVHECIYDKQADQNHENQNDLNHPHTHDHDHNCGHDHTHDHGHPHHHHASMAGISHIIEHLNLPEEVKNDIVAVYRLIAEAESHVHGKTVEEIHFHEVGTADAIADIAGVCLLMHRIAPQKVIAIPDPCWKRKCPTAPTGSCRYRTCDSIYFTGTPNLQRRYQR